MTKEDSNDIIEQKKKDGVYIRTIKSFVKREGRLTKGQEAALEQLWPTMGLEHKRWHARFQRSFR